MTARQGGGHGVPEGDAKHILNAWLIEGDFLLVDLPYTFTHAVGNPPYVRQELIPDELMAEYRMRYNTIYDRADLYVPFIERCLSLLSEGGTLGFICSDRWMKNKYGGPLRAMISEGYHLACYVNMVDTPAFHTEVSVYPAITIIRREKPGPTRIAHRPRIDRETLETLAQDMRADAVPDESGVVEMAGVAVSSEPWILQSFDQLAVVRRQHRGCQREEVEGEESKAQQQIDGRMWNSRFGMKAGLSHYTPLHFLLTASA